MTVLSRRRRRTPTCDVSTLAAVLALLATAVGGCDRGPQRVALRLGPADFVGGQAPTHEPVVQIDDEARPVLMAPETIAVFQLRAERPPDGIVRFTAKLPERALRLPDDAYSLKGMRRDFHPGEDEVAVGAAIVSKVPVPHWTLKRSSADGRQAVVEAHVPPSLGDRFVLYLRATLPAAPRLISRRFELPARSDLVLGYGVAGGAARPVRFGAWLTCAGRPKRTLLRDRVAAEPGAPGSWRQATMRLPKQSADCRLVLRQGAPGGGQGVWCPPYFLGADAATALPRNVIVISLDTLRGDRLSGYGYARPTTPSIDARLIATGTAFTQASTTFPFTQIAHMSLFTGLYADAQVEGHTVPANTPVVLLAERLRDGGFETAAYTENAAVAGTFGFWHGFESFTERAFVAASRGRETFRDGARFVRERRNRRFFLFLHTYKVHNPYMYGAPYEAFFTEPTQRLADVAPAVPVADRAAMDKYDRAVRELDDQVAGFLDAVDDAGIADDTLIVLLSDHGEAFGEHGVRGHGFGGHQEQIAIPLVFRGPGIPTRRVATPVSIVDVAPTILEIFDLPPLMLGQGRSLRAAFTGGSLSENRPIYFGWGWLDGRSAGLRVGSMKYLALPEGGRVFDLARDPGETAPVVTDVAEYERLLALAQGENASLRARLRHRPAGRPAQVVPRKVEESLRALGYL